MGGFPWLEVDERFTFPDPETADSEGVVACGGNLSPGMLLSAYSQGIFPWFSEGGPILWWSPDPRFVVFPCEVHVSGTMKKILRQGRFGFSFDSAFREVITSCAAAPRPGQNGTWITHGMVEAYCRLYELGYAHSVEVWERGRLAGGLYGVALGKIFFGESMFSRAGSASKAGFIFLSEVLGEKGFRLIDSQVRTDHVAALGGREIPRREYLEILRQLLGEEEGV